MSLNKYPVRLLSLAEKDLEELLTYVAAENATAALTLADQIEKELLSLGAYPWLGKIPNDQSLAGMGYRVLVVENYLIFYKVVGKAVLVYRIIHGARDLPSLLKDL
ncbi:MAG: type II toxin-antitoxin system RelE/ParE family toxin [Nitrospirales bacterium]|nr:type II toxin-antitoxin system RelE/ParE family toxin [Nitrospirales bacterium]